MIFWFQVRNKVYLLIKNSKTKKNSEKLDYIKAYIFSKANIEIISYKLKLAKDPKYILWSIYYF